MRTATLIVGGVFSYIGIMFFAALEASTAAPIPAALNPAPSADTLESGLVTVSHADTWSQCLPKNQPFYSVAVFGTCMAKVYPALTPELRSFIEAQQIFFVGTAPLSPEGHVNLSPKGLDSFRIFSDNQVAYLDLTGSGNETSAHLQENGRITFMFCAFKGKPLILRLYGQGQVYVPGQVGWDTLAEQFPSIPGTRQIIVATIDRVQTSCGSGVPLYEYQAQRDEMIHWAEKKGETGIKTYHREKNMVSIDGLPTPLQGAIADS